MRKDWSIVVITKGKTSAKIKIKEGTNLLSFQEVFNHWENNPDFIDFYVKAILAFGFKAIYWEHPALQSSFLHLSYECILIKSNSFDRLSVNESAFAKFFSEGKEVVVFDNLGKDAKLVVPTKNGTAADYKHLESFLTNAKLSQIRAMFKAVGNTVLSELSAGKLIWLNTAGLGVIWLHVRLDTRPKYYKTAVYKRADFLNFS